MKKPLVLVVEDNDLNMELITDVLELGGFEVLRAQDGPAGVEAAAANSPDLVLMDLQLPGMDGLEATRRLKADPATASIPVIALTAHAMASDRQCALAAGCDDFETKPIEFDRLLAKIEALTKAQPT